MDKDIADRPTENNPSKDALIEAAKELFALNGYRGTSVREIASAAETNVSMISYYFGGKEGLYREILESLSGEIKGLFDGPSVTSLPPGERVSLYARSVSGMHDENPCLARIIHNELHSPTSMLQELQRELFPKVFGFLIKAFEDGIKEKTFRDDIDPKVMSYCLASMVNFYRLQKELVQSVIPSLMEDESNLADKVLEVFLKGVTL